jgi:hypothetical protein
MRKFISFTPIVTAYGPKDPLTGHWLEKSVSNKSLRGCFRSSIWTEPCLKIFWSSLYKLQFFINSPSLYKSKGHPLPLTIDNGGKPHINKKYIWQTADHRGKPVCMLLPATSDGEQIGGEKLAVLLSPWQPLVKLFSPVSRPQTTKMGHGHTRYQSNSWVLHRLSNYSAVWGHK